MSAPEAIAAAAPIPCHCIIAHPGKAKFLVIRHTDRWAPPILQVPGDGHLMYKPALINQGMMQKYGLRTTVLRIVMEMQNYALIELEMHASSQQQMQAVWVGREEYARFRSTPEGEEDPLENWLDEREKAPVPELRAPWERRGWYGKAERWMSDKLVEQGIQASGSVQQFKAGWPTACLLRVATVQGQVFFKASYDKPPGEARLTRFLSERWPDLVPEPLAVDERRHWMLLRDYRMKKENRPPRESYAEFAATLGRFQVDAAGCLENWHELTCPVMDEGLLLGEDGRLESLLGRADLLLASGPAAWNKGDRVRLRTAVRAAIRAVRVLCGYGIPDSLSHLDFRPDNFFLEDGKYRVIDWADVAIGHPFMAFCQTLEYFERREREKSLPASEQAIDEPIRNEMEAAYLSSFEGLMPKGRLKAAFEQARAVFPLFWFLYLTSKMDLVEPGTPQWGNLNSLLGKMAGQLVERHGGGG